MASAIRVERIVDLSPALVGAAFTDPVLVEGWLHPTARLIDGQAADPVVTASSPWAIETVDTQLGRLRVELRVEAGGTRGGVTRVRVDEFDLDSESARLDAIALWNTRLDQLESLLRGHPVNWSTWSADHGASYERYRAAAAVGLSPT